MDAVANHDSQLLKGVLVLVLLRLIDQRESYGYGLVGRVHAAGLGGVAEGSIYPALTRLERDGHLLTRLAPTKCSPPRKYYRLSVSGRQFMRARTLAWQSLVNALSALLADEATNTKEVVS
jgi:PadR family transcriptional regulator, regulatory protein PadR